MPKFFTERYRQPMPQIDNGHPDLETLVEARGAILAYPAVDVAADEPDPSDLDEWVRVGKQMIASLNDERDRLIARIQEINEQVRQIKEAARLLGQQEADPASTIIKRSRATDEGTSADGDNGEYAHWKGMTKKAMIVKWSELHGGRVVMSVMARALVRSGVFDTPVEAAGLLYPSVKRLPGFEKVARGVYVLTSVGNATALADRD